MSKLLYWSALLWFALYAVGLLTLMWGGEPETGVKAAPCIFFVCLVVLCALSKYVGY